MSELELLKLWGDERHTEIRQRLDRIDERLYRIESLPVLKAAAMVEKLTTKRVVAVGAAPGIGGMLYFIQWLRHILP